MPPPYVAVKNVKPAERTPIYAPAQLNARLTEVIAHQQAPDPIRQGDTPARPARRPMYSVVAKRQMRAVMAEHQSGVMGKTAFALLMRAPQGKSLTWDERVNIQRRPSEPLGSRFQLSPQIRDEYRLRMMMGA
jgi:hypothetical protein